MNYIIPIMGSLKRNKQLMDALKKWGFPLFAIIFLIVLSKTFISSELTQLEIIADLSIEKTDELLKERNLQEISDQFSKISDSYSLDGILLLEESGVILVGDTTEAEVIIQSIELGGTVSLATPLSIKYQYVEELSKEAHPQAYLILYSSSPLFLFLVLLTVFVALLVLNFASLFRTLKLQSNVTKTARNGSEFQENINDPAANRIGQIPDKISQLEKERDAALATVRAKGDFLAHISHEIRTSLNGIMGVLSLLKTSGIVGEKKRLVDAAENSAHSLLFIVDDILDFSKITSGKIEFESIQFNLREVVEDCLALYKDAARAKKLALHSYMPLEINPDIYGDPTRLRQILTNLLSNAVKFTNKGNVSLRLSLVEENGESQRLRFTVEDTGIGIAVEKLEGIFDMFTQADEKTARKYGGTGLGLTVCKNLIELQNGEIGVKSRPGHGTLFWFSLDFNLSKQAKEQHLVEAVAGKEIVLFENCETCSTILHQYLPNCTIHNKSADDIDEVLEKLEAAKVDSDKVPEIVLVDHSCLANRSNRLLQELDILFPTNRPACFILLQNSNLEQKILTQGFTGIIHKPIRLRQLYNELSGRIVHDSYEQANNELEYLQGKVLLVDDEIINQHVGEMILRKLGLDVDLAGSGVEALAKTSERDYDLVLMDIQMPDMSGIEATEKIRAREKDMDQEPLVIIAVTANALGSMRQRSLDAGMNGFIVKPIQSHLLYDYISPWLTYGSAPESQDDPIPAAVDEDDALDNDEQATWDRNLALQYLGGDEVLLQDLMKLFIDRKNKLLLAIEDAMKTTDGEAISCAAHAFKGAVNHFAARKCQRLALAIEYKAGEGGLEGLDTCFAELRAAADNLEEELKQQVVT